MAHFFTTVPSCPGGTVDVKKTTTMNKKNYIKVTTEDGNTAIITAANKDFYLRTGAKVEEPTDEEIASVIPEYKQENTEQDNETGKTILAAYEEKAKECELHKDEILVLRKQVKSLQDGIATLQEERDKLKAELAALTEDTAKKAANKNNKSKTTK